MKKADLARSAQVGFKNMSTGTANAIIDAITSGIADAVARGGKVEIRGFGVFHPREFSARRGYSPSAGKHVAMPGGRKVLFRPSPLLVKKMNKM
ncbi:MAG: HU family DNA-binding protein [Rickettsiales bacterium]|nr:HU family DNA-binding protein [Rickettsiales bacterium]